MQLPPRLSVAICTHDRYPALAQSVETLLWSQGFATADAELLVIENTPAARRQALDLPDRADVRSVVCEEPGLSQARNCAIAAAQGEVIAFLDDDALVCDDWCSAILDRMHAGPELGALGGKVAPLFDSDDLPHWFDDRLCGHLSCIDWGDTPRFLRPGEWVVGANMAFRREVVARFGGFDANLGRRGTTSLLSNEETALLARIGLHSVFYDPAMAVRHVIPPERLTPQWFRSRVYWQAVSDLVAGHVRSDDAGLRQEYGRLVVRLEARHRNLNALSFAPRDADEFQIQLRAIYLAAVVLAGGAGGAPEAGHA